MQNLPLKGIRVIDYSHFLAGPHMSRCLSAMGAEVIKVERPVAGDVGRASPTMVGGQSGYFMQQNMGKQGLCINLRDPRGLDRGPVAERLCAVRSVAADAGIRRFRANLFFDTIG